MYHTHTPTEVIDLLREVYASDRFEFDSNVCTYLSGDSLKQLRQGIILKITGEKRPLTKCGMFAVSDVLKAYYEQYSLF